MTTEDPNLPPTAPKWARIPGPIQLKLEQAIIDHRRAHGREMYDLLRDHPEFAPWIGTHLGHRGDKRLDRMIRDVERRVLRQSALRKARTRAFVEPNNARLPSRPDQAALSDPAEEFTRAGSGVLSLIELHSRLRQDICDLDEAIDAIRGDSCVPASGEFYKLLRERRATYAAAADLSKRYQRIANSEGAIRGIVDAAVQDLSDSDKAAVLQRFNKVFSETSGLPASGSR